MGAKRDRYANIPEHLNLRPPAALLSHDYCLIVTFIPQCRHPLDFHILTNYPWAMKSISSAGTTCWESVLSCQGPPPKGDSRSSPGAGTNAASNGTWDCSRRLSTTKGTWRRSTRRHLTPPFRNSRNIIRFGWVIYETLSELKIMNVWHPYIPQGHR